MMGGAIGAFNAAGEKGIAVQTRVEKILQMPAIYTKLLKKFFKLQLKSSAKFQKGLPKGRLVLPRCLIK